VVVLVVDDEPLIRLGVASLLEELGHDAIDASTGRQALQLLREHPSIDLMLTDFRMPGLSGLELIAECRTIRPDIKIILMTGYSSVDYTFPADCPVRLEKPFSIHDLMTAITDVT
jgi:YesN/AraC family two-component response regulator